MVMNHRNVWPFQSTDATRSEEAATATSARPACSRPRSLGLPTLKKTLSANTTSRFRLLVTKRLQAVCGSRRRKVSLLHQHAPRVASLTDFTTALALSEQYGMRQWIEALLDPQTIEKGNKDKHTTRIQMPPRFDSSKVPSLAAQAPALRATRARSTRSASPSKMATPRKIATPRKPRTRKAEQVVQTEEMEITETATATSSALENGVVASESAASASVNGEVKEPETVRIEVQETIETVGDVETKTTNVKVDVPADHPELREPEDPKALMEEAQRMVEEAKKLDGGESSKSASKRKAEELGEDEAAERPQRPAKLARTQSTLEQKLAKEKVTRRALVGVTVMAAITYVLPSFIRSCPWLTLDSTAVSYFAGFAA